MGGYSARSTGSSCCAACFVAGTWRVENGRVVPEPFAALSRSLQRDLKEEGGRLEAFLAD